jgi:hypothetical protein
MPLAITELAKARDTVAGLLDELGLDAYLFEVDPKDDIWKVKIECAIEEGWETITLSVGKQMLLADLDEVNVREQLLGEWRAKLSACKTRLS